jgi:hypothetical protein
MMGRIELKNMAATDTKWSQAGLRQPSFWR